MALNVTQGHKPWTAQRAKCYCSTCPISLMTQSGGVATPRHVTWLGDKVEPKQWQVYSKHMHAAEPSGGIIQLGLPEWTVLWTTLFMEGQVIKSANWSWHAYYPVYGRGCLWLRIEVSKLPLQGPDSKYFILCGHLASVTSTQLSHHGIKGIKESRHG